MSNYHTPVLVAEVLTGLTVRAGEKYIDATVGDGGFTLEIVRNGGVVLGLDADKDALARAKERLGDRNAVFVHANFADIASVAKREGFDPVTGIVFDLGVSSYQLDTEDRGFSFRSPEAPLDLRYDAGRGEPASELVNRLSVDELYEIFTKFGEEERARSIARSVVRTRRLKPIQTTGDLADIVREAVSNASEHTKSLARVFQALRMAVNDEAGALVNGLSGAQRLLRSGGRLTVISFHSLEDRVVKKFMLGPEWIPITKKPMIPTTDEIRRNPRSRSAKLRIAQKI